MRFLKMRIGLWLRHFKVRILVAQLRRPPGREFSGGLLFAICFSCRPTACKEKTDQKDRQIIADGFHRGSSRTIDHCQQRDLNYRKNLRYNLHGQKYSATNTSTLLLSILILSSFTYTTFPESGIEFGRYHSDVSAAISQR